MGSGRAELNMRSRVIIVSSEPRWKLKLELRVYKHKLMVLVMSHVSLQHINPYVEAEEAQHPPADTWDLTDYTDTNLHFLGRTRSSLLRDIIAAEADQQNTLLVAR